MKKKIITRIIIGFLILITIVTVAGYWYLNTQFNKVKHVDIPKGNLDLGIGSGNVAFDNDITNIALFGMDRHTDNTTGRSDAIIILSIDNKHDKIKLSSIMRDTYVEVEGHGMTKLGHAYAFGGPVLAIKTLNSNFRLNIKDFVTVDFEGFTRIIDALGGITMNIKSYEIPGSTGMNTVGIYSSGTYNLNGDQALRYARIRQMGNADYERTDRQRAVLLAIFEKEKSEGAAKFVDAVINLLPYTETSLSLVDVLRLGNSVFTSDISTLDQIRFPLDGYCQGKIIEGRYYLVTDLEATAKQINKFIYDDEKPYDVP